MNLMSIIGHFIALLGLYGLYTGELVIGSIAFLMGGLFASKLFICLRSSGVMMVLVSSAYGFHHEYTALVITLIIVGLVLACFSANRKSKNQGDGWGVDFDFISSSSSSDSGSGGDFGGGD